MDECHLTSGQVGVELFSGECEPSPSAVVDAADKVEELPARAE